jgi:hypothetical protein
VKVPAIIVAVTLFAAILVTTSLLVLAAARGADVPPHSRTTVLGTRLHIPFGAEISTRRARRPMT